MSSKLSIHLLAYLRTKIKGIRDVLNRLKYNHTRHELESLRKDIIAMVRVRIYANFIDGYYGDEPYAEVDLQDNNDVKSLYYFIVRGLDIDYLTREEIDEVLRCGDTSCLDMLEELWSYGIIFDYLFVGDVTL